MKLLCDQMLGTLARWLRLLGFDVYYANEKTTDDEILDIAEKEKRVVISRDKQLVERAEKRRMPNIEVTSTDLDEQLKTVTSVYPVNNKTVLSRCSLCNTPLLKVKKEDVKGKVPSKVFDAHEEFWYCKKCDKIYWKGSHWVRIEEKMKELTEKVKAS
ncbi:MAG: Mut7-C RNAse domain-containing protein [Thermoplasmata archaeon]|nr:Mut7-C RNAse domain-containing protein [Thermoplasmata archaeon]RLF25968.1 MAG: hypothetical protein DRN01_05815 [Thermoplasmata archaeon]